MATGDEVLLSEIENVDSQAGLFGEDLEKSMFRVRFIFVHSGDLMSGRSVPSLWPIFFLPGRP